MANGYASTPAEPRLMLGPQPLPKRLLEPLVIGRYRLPHRVVMAPLTRCRVTEPNIPNQLMVEYYAQRASAALIVTEATAISQSAQGYWRTPGIYDLAHVAGWQKISEAVHARDGLIFMQIWHNGRVFHPDNVPWKGRSLAPSAVAPDIRMMTPFGPQSPPVPDELTVSGIKGIIADFALAARNAILAGMDGIELHAANGYIFEQFLNRSANRRTDAYGGAIANRSRFMREVIEAVVAAVGPDRVGVRISPFGVLNDMSDPDPLEVYTHVLELLDRLDLAYLHLIRPAVSGNQDSAAGQAMPDPVRIVRDHYRGRTIVAGGLEVAEAEEMVAAGVADAIAFGRWFVSNPDLPQRLMNRWPLNDFDRPTFYTQGPVGYVDYPAFTPAEA